MKANRAVGYIPSADKKLPALKAAACVVAIALSALVFTVCCVILVDSASGKLPDFGGEAFYLNDGGAVSSYGSGELLVIDSEGNFSVGDPVVYRSGAGYSAARIKGIGAKSGESFVTLSFDDKPGTVRVVALTAVEGKIIRGYPAVGAILRFLFRNRVAFLISASAVAAYEILSITLSSFRPRCAKSLI